MLTPDDGDDTAHAHQRAEARRNMFVMATLYCPGGSAPARIRNMSRTGALIESAVEAPENSPVRLSRGTLSVSGSIAWRLDNRAGVRFDAVIQVDDWLPGGGGGSTGQQRVDEIIHSCRTLQAGEFESSASAPPAAAGLADVARQLAEIRDALNAAGEVLAEDMAVAMAHPAPLQTLDISIQKLERLAARLNARF
jgi:hypothetical protein